MPSRKSTAPMAVKRTASGKQVRKPAAKRRSTSRKTTGPRPKRKIGRKILFIALLIVAGHYGWKYLGPASSGGEAVVTDSLAVEPAQVTPVDVQKSATSSDTVTVAEKTKSNKLKDLFAKIDTEKWFGWAEEWVDKVFVVRDVQLSGALSIPRDSLLARTDTLVGQPVFDLQLFDIAQQIASHPRVRRAKVSRRLPSTLVIYVDERREEMVVVAENGLCGVDSDNIVLPSPPPGWPVDVPLITGFKGELAVGDTIADADLLEAAEWIRRAQRTPRVHGWMSEVHIGLLGVDWIGGINGWRVDPGGHAVIAQVATLDAYLEQNDAQPAQVSEERRLDLRFPGFLIVKHGI